MRFMISCDIRCISSALRGSWNVAKYTLNCTYAKGALGGAKMYSRCDGLVIAFHSAYNEKVHQHT